MNLLFGLLLFVHICTGTVALSAAVAAVTAKTVDVSHR